MNEMIQMMIQRRSCKKYTDKMVSKKDIEEIIEAGLYAASGQGKQSPIIVAITDKNTRDALSKMNAEVMQANIDPFYGAPVVLVVLADKSVRTAVYDGSLVIGNMMLAAESKGIGACWIHRAKEVFESEEGKALLCRLGIVGDYEGVGNCILGYRDGEVPTPPKRKENRVFWVE